MSALDWSYARSQMLLDPTVINLNTGSFGPWPISVFHRVTALRHRLAEEPMDFLLRQLPPLLWNARERLAAFLGGDPYRLVFTSNVTVAINKVAAGLRLTGPGEILMTDHEYGSMQWCWERAAQRQGLSVRTFPLPTMAANPTEVVDAFVSHLHDRTRLLFFSHILSPTGMILPAREICAEARRRGILTVVDGAHAPAMVPLELDRLGADFYGGNCHKWLLAATGAGFLYLRAGNEDRLEPDQVSWGYHHDQSKPDERDPFGSTPRLRALEFEGTVDSTPWLAIPEAIDFHHALGGDHIRARMRELSDHVRTRFLKIPGLSLDTPEHSELRGSLTAFRIAQPVQPLEVRKNLWERHRIEIPIVERPGKNLLRVSGHFYNTEEEGEKLAAAWEELVV